MSIKTDADQVVPVVEGPQPSIPLELLARLLVTTTIYPPTHPRCLEVAASACEELAAANDPLHLSIETAGIRVDGTEVLTKSGPVERLRRDLHSLGIHELRIPTATTASNLIELMHKLLDATRASLRGTWDRKAWQESLPGAVEVEQQQFVEGSGGTGRGASNSVRSNLIQEALRPLAGVAIQDELRDDITRFVATVIDTAVDIGNQRSAEERARSGVTEDDLMSIAVLTIRRLIETRLNSNEKELDLESLFEDFDRSLGAAGSDESTKQVVQRIKSITSGLLGENFRLAKPLVQASSFSQTEVAPARQFVAQLERWVQSLPPAPPTRSCPAECLFISIEIATRSISASRNRVFRERLYSTLTSDVVADCVDMLTEGVRQLCRFHRREAVDFLLPLLASRWPDEGVPQWVTFLERVCAALEGEDLAMLWPHLACAIVFQDRPDQSKELMVLVQSFSKVPVERVLGESQRFLDAFPTERARACQNNLPSPHGYLLPLYEILLTDRQLGPLQDALLDLFQKFPLDTPTGHSVAFLTEKGPASRRFLLEVLQEQRQGRQDPALTRRAARLLSRRLSRLEPSQRSEGWVNQAIQSLGRLPCAESRILLERICEEKRMGLIKTWPANCRAYADQALVSFPPER